MENQLVAPRTVSHGYTLIRQFALGTAIAMFSLSAGIVWTAGREVLSVFASWYACALGLLAIGLFGSLIQKSRISVVAWAGRAVLCVGGFYMLIAAIALLREIRVGNCSAIHNNI